jgi:hypothetical protein
MYVRTECTVHMHAVISTVNVNKAVRVLDRVSLSII